MVYRWSRWNSSLEIDLPVPWACTLKLFQKRYHPLKWNVHVLIRPTVFVSLFSRIKTIKRFQGQRYSSPLNFHRLVISYRPSNMLGHKQVLTGLWHYNQLWPRALIHNKTDKNNSKLLSSRQAELWQMNLERPRW